jgi:hypothetical protein
MKTINMYQISTFLLGLIFLAGCAQFEEFESAELSDGPALTVSLSAAGDSLITVEMTSSANGYIVAALMSDTANPVPENKESLAKGNIVNDEYFYKEVEANEVVSYTFTTGVFQNAFYEIMAVAADENGVLSDIEVLEVATADTYAPGFVTSYPGFTYDPILVQGDTIVLEFDEMVVLGEGNFSIETFFTGQVVEVPAGNLFAVENYVFVILPEEFPYREYIWMHWEADAVEDISGNGVAALNTTYDSDAGAFLGAYWRMTSMSFDVQSVTPEDGSDQTPGFDIVLSYKEAVDISELTDGDIILTYNDGAGITSIIEVPLADISATGGDIIIRQNAFLASAGTVTIDIPAGVVFDGFGNSNNAFTASWNLN